MTERLHAIKTLQPFISVSAGVLRSSCISDTRQYKVIILLLFLLSVPESFIILGWPKSSFYPDFLKPHLYFTNTHSLIQWLARFLPELNFITIFNVPSALIAWEPKSLGQLRPILLKFYSSLQAYLQSVTWKYQEPPDIPFVCNSLKRIYFRSTGKNCLLLWLLFERMW